MKAPEPPPAQRPAVPAPANTRAAPRPPAPPPATPPSVTPPPAPSAAVQRAIAEAEAPAQQPVDLYTAMVAEGMATPPTQPAALPSRAAPPTPPPAAPPGVQRKPEAPNSAVPDPGSVEAAMLELLKLPPNTAVYGLKRPSEAAPPASSSPAPSNGAPGIQAKRLDEALAESGSDDSGFVQRAIEIGEVSASVEGGQGAQGAAEPDVEELARKVYQILRQRLRIERERSPR